MQYSQEHLKTMVYAEFGGQTECIMENSKIEKALYNLPFRITLNCRANSYVTIFAYQSHLACQHFISMIVFKTKFNLASIAGLYVTSRRPRWWSRTEAFLSSGN